MTVHVTRTVLVLAIATATACNTPRAGTDAPPAEEPGAAATTASAGETPGAPAKQAPAATAAQSAKAAEAQRERVIAEQKALNEQQAETNARLQQEVERLKPRGDYDTRRDGHSSANRFGALHVHPQRRRDIRRRARQ